MCKYTELIFLIVLKLYLLILVGLLVVAVITIFREVYKHIKHVPEK